MKIEDSDLLIPDDRILDKIYLIRSRKIMLDRDLAKLYGVTTGNLNKAVKRNIKRFPEDFMFQLNNNEFGILLFQTGIARWGGTRNLPLCIYRTGCCYAVWHLK